MRKHRGTPYRRDKDVTLAVISPPGVGRGRFVRGQQSGLAGCKSPPLFKCGASSCSSQRQRQREPWGASPQPSAPTYLPTWNDPPHTTWKTRGKGLGMGETRERAPAPTPQDLPRAPRTNDKGTAPAKAVVAHSATHKPNG